MVKKKKKKVAKRKKEAFSPLQALGMLVIIILALALTIFTSEAVDNILILVAQGAFLMLGRGI